MKHLFTVGAFLISSMLGIVVPFSVSATSLTTKSFGGKVYLTPIPYLVCNGGGASLITSSNIKGLTNMINSVRSTKNEEEANNKVKNILEANNNAKDIVNVIPTYATDVNKKPRIMGQILGRQNLVPDMSTCYVPSPVGPIYIPVFKTTDNYNVSKY